MPDPKCVPLVLVKRIWPGDDGANTAVAIKASKKLRIIVLIFDASLFLSRKQKAVLG